MNLTFNQKRILGSTIMLFALFCHLNLQYEWNFFGEYDHILKYVGLAGVFGFFAKFGASFMQEARERGEAADPERGIAPLTRQRRQKWAYRAAVVFVFLVPFIVGPFAQVARGEESLIEDWMFAWLFGLALVAIYIPFQSFINKKFFPDNEASE